jgi:transposase
MLNIIGLKSRNLITVPLDIPNVAVLSGNQNERRDLMITVESTQVGTRCQHCGQPITKRHGRDRWLELRHLPILGQRTYIRLQPQRYECPACAGQTTTQTLAWYTSKSPHTKAYDDHLMLQLINSTVEDVSRKEDIGYDAVEGALARRIQAQVNWAEFTELGTLGIDEIALTKGHDNFVALLTSQQADGHVALLAVLPDRKKETVRHFLDTIPPHLRATLHTVCTDMWDGYVNAVKEFAAAHDDVKLTVVIDRFHVAKHYRDGVDQLRKREGRRLKAALPAVEYAELKDVMWPLRKNHRDLTPEERLRLRRLFTYAPALKLAYTLREELTAIFDLPLTKAQAKHRLRKWCAKVRRSALSCFDSFLKTLTHWLDEIVNYFAARRSSGFVEGLNNKIKTLKRRCYGIGRVATLFQRLYLDLEGYRRFA